MRDTLIVPLVFLFALPRAEAAGDDLLAQARAALANGQPQAAITLTSQALAKDARSATAYFLRGAAYETLARHREAVADFDQALRLDPTQAEAYNHRGSEHFKLGNIRQSLADFDRFLELRPAERPGHWRRGITCYYAGQFDEGRKQFEGYEKVDTNDVENAAWHFLCNARQHGVEKARREILKIGNDRRVPMMQVYALYAGTLKPEDVLAAAAAGNPTPAQRTARLFYAHLYLGLYYEVLGDRARALEHLTRAEEQRIPHYMWDVARVHRALLAQPPRANDP